MEEALNNQVDKATWPDDISQPLSSTPPVLVQGGMNKVAMVARMEAVHGPNSIDIHASHPQDSGFMVERSYS